MRYAGYVRVSRVGGREGDSFISPDVQQEQIRAWATIRHATIIGFHTDLDMSGAKRDRPGLEQAIGMVERKEVDGIVVAKLDRLARSLPVAFDAIQRIEEAGGRLVSVDEGIDPSTANGRLMRNLLLMMAEWYREQIREQWAIARERAVSRGAFVSSTVATGYRRGKDGRLEPHPQWAPVIRDVFERRARGESVSDLARHMTAQGVPTQYAADGVWTTSTINKLLSGRVYLGEVRHGKFVNTNAHEPIVPLAAWHAANAARSAVPGRSNADPWLLTGLLRCAGCGYGMMTSRGRGPAGTRIRSYRCRGGGSTGPCEDRAFADADALEELIVAEYLGHAEGLAVEGTPDSPDLAAALEALSEAEHGLKVFRDDPRIIGKLGADGFAEGLSVRARLVSEARDRIAATRLPTIGVPDVLELRSVWPDITVVQRRRLLVASLDCVVVAGKGPVVPGRVRFCWAGLAPDDLPRRGKRNSTRRPIPLDSLPAETRVQFAR